MHENAIPPPQAQRCPICRYDLRGTIAGGERRCPECGFAFTLDQLYAMNVSNPEGAPRSLAPNRLRVEGPQMLLYLFSTVVFILIVMSLLLAVF